MIRLHYLGLRLVFGVRIPGKDYRYPRSIRSPSKLNKLYRTVPRYL